MPAIPKRNDSKITQRGTISDQLERLVLQDSKFAIVRLKNLPPGYLLSEVFNHFFKTFFYEKDNSYCLFGNSVRFL